VVVGTWVTARAPRGWHELVAEVLGGGSGAAIEIQDEGEGRDAVLVKAWLPDTGGPVRARLRENLRETLLRTGVPGLEKVTLTFEEALLPEIRWPTRPIRVGALVLAPVSTPGARARGLPVLVTAGGPSFGHGDHPTTRACLFRLGSCVRNGDRVLDVGCGSGILGVGCLLLGAASVVGLDPDPLAEDHLRVLAARNGVTGRIELRKGELEATALRGETYSGVVANIYADVLAKGASVLARTLEPGGWLVASGCAEARTAEVRAGLEEAGIHISGARTRRGFSTLHGMRKHGQGERQ